MSPWRPQRQLLIHADAGRDLNKVWDRDPEAGARIGAFLQQAKSTPELLEIWTDHGYGSYRTEDFHVSKWQSQQAQGRNLWRVKIWGLSKAYRVVYAFDPPLKHYVLGIAIHDTESEKGFDYQDEHEFTRRVVSVYESLGLGTS